LTVRNTDKQRTGTGTGEIYVRRKRSEDIMNNLKVNEMVYDINGYRIYEEIAFSGYRGINMQMDPIQCTCSEDR
jgi:hypothetical protein